MRDLAEAGMTMVIVTHELNFAREVGDLQRVHGPRPDRRVREARLFDTCTNPRTKQFIEAVL
jgi:ABC-type polar amino acid transport system ATPase subunit